MATKQGKKTSASRGNSHKSSQGKNRNKNSRQYTEQESALFHEVMLLLLFAAAVVLFLCNFGVIGTVCKAISGLLFWLFGFLA